MGTAWSSFPTSIITCGSPICRQNHSIVMNCPSCICSNYTTVRLSVRVSSVQFVHLYCAALTAWVRSQITPVGLTEKRRFQSALELSECRGCVTDREFKSREVCTRPNLCNSPFFTRTLILHTTISDPLAVGCVGVTRVYIGYGIMALYKFCIIFNSR